MKEFKVPSKNDVSENNKAIFDQMEKAYGMVPNLYALYAYSDTALADYLSLQNRESSFSTREKEVINLSVSQVNNCKYCLAAHTAIAKMNGFTDEQIMELRQGKAPFDARLNALAAFCRETTLTRGKPASVIVDNFFAAGYDEAALIDAIIAIGDKTISNYLHGITRIPVDFPPAREMLHI